MQASFSSHCRSGWSFDRAKYESHDQVSFDLLVRTTTQCGSELDDGPVRL